MTARPIRWRTITPPPKRWPSSTCTVAAGGPLETDCRCRATRSCSPTRRRRRARRQFDRRDRSRPARPARSAGWASLAGSSSAAAYARRPGRQPRHPCRRSPTTERATAKAADRRRGGRALGCRARRPGRPRGWADGRSASAPLRRGYRTIAAIRGAARRRARTRARSRWRSRCAASHRRGAGAGAGAARPGGRQRRGPQPVRCRRRRRLADRSPPAMRLRRRRFRRASPRPDGSASLHRLAASARCRNVGSVTPRRRLDRDHSPGDSVAERTGADPVAALDVGAWGNRLLVSVEAGADGLAAGTRATALNAAARARGWRA